MSLRGRPAKPSAIREAEGNRGKRPLPKREPKPKAGTPPAPADLGAGARAEYKRLAVDLESMRVLTLADRGALAATARAWEEYLEARREVQAWAKANEGRVTVPTASGGLVAHPATKIASDAWRRYVTGLSHFGLTPATRTKVQTLGDDADADPFAGYLRGIDGGKREA